MVRLANSRTLDAGSVLPRPAKPGWRELATAFRLTVRLIRDARVSRWVKLIPIAALLYVLLPFDLVKDFLPGLGQVDDFLVLWLAYHLFVWLCPAEVVEEHRAVLARVQRLPTP